MAELSLSTLHPRLQELINLTAIRAVDRGECDFHRPSLVTTIIDKVKELAELGEVELVEMALEIVRDYNSQNKKPAINPRNKFWQLAEIAKDNATNRKPFWAMCYREFEKHIKPIRHFEKYDYLQRSEHAASFRLGPRQRTATGEYIYYVEQSPGVCFSTAQGAKMEAHRFYIEKALLEGQTVPPEVLAEYPELIRK